MTLIVFLVDDSPSMNQPTYMGVAFIDFAKQIIESFIKQRQRDPASSSDRYMLTTFEDYPANIKSGWKEGQRVFTEQLKNLKTRGRSKAKFETALGSVLRFLNTNRMQFVESRESYGLGRFPSTSEFAIIISIVDGSSLPYQNLQKEVIIPKPNLPGNDLTAEAFRWDHRHFSIVIRLPGVFDADATNGVPPPDESIAEELCTQMGGIDAIVQRIQLNGVIVQLTQTGPDPPIPQGPEDSSDLITILADPAWRNVLALVKCRPQNLSRWPFPEAYWPESIGKFPSIPPRRAIPQIYFKCVNIEQITNRQLLHYDSYELERSPLTQIILSRHGTCWPVFMANSGKPPNSDDYPFGYIKASSSMQSIGLFVTAYNFPALLPLLEEATNNKAIVSTPGFRQRFESYLKTVPFYYYQELKKMWARHQIQVQSLEEALMRPKPYHAADLSRLIARIKGQGQRDFEFVCTEVYKNIQVEASKPPASRNAIVKVSKSRIALARASGPSSLAECRHRPTLNQYRQQIPDIYKDLLVYALPEAEPKQSRPSEQFKNPFEIPRENLVSQLLKMQINFDQQLQLESLHSFQGGLPGQKIRLQHVEDLSSQPIQRMGAYEEYMKRLQEIGLGPMRPIDDQEKPRSHAFGNPFKLDKKNMSIVDEVGEMTTDSNNGASTDKRSQKELSKAQGTPAASAEPSTSSAKSRPPRRKPGPLDTRSALDWRRRFRPCGSDSDSDISDTASVCSGISDLSDLSSLAGGDDPSPMMGARYSPIRKRSFSATSMGEEGEVEDEDDERQSIDDPEYRSSEEDDDGAQSTWRMDDEAEALLRGAHIGPHSSKVSAYAIPPNTSIVPSNSAEVPLQSNALSTNKEKGKRQKLREAAPNPIKQKSKPAKRPGADSRDPTNEEAERQDKRPKLTEKSENREKPANLAEAKKNRQPTATRDDVLNGRSRLQAIPSPMIEFPPPDESDDSVGRPRPPPSVELKQAVRDIQKTVRQFTTNAVIFDQCSRLIADSPLNHRRELHALAVREAQRFRRAELVERLRGLVAGGGNGQ